MNEPEVARRHLRACDGFGRAVDAAEGRWERPSPCPDWDARGVLEHVIGFHDVLLLRPLDAKPDRPKDDAPRRWAVTRDALATLLTHSDLWDAPLVAMLTQDVLVHTWDLARAIGADDHLDPDLCELYVAKLPADTGQPLAAGMFGPPVPVAPGADAQSRLLARLGRDPGWQPATTAG